MTHTPKQTAGSKNAILQILFTPLPAAILSPAKLLCAYLSAAHVPSPAVIFLYLSNSSATHALSVMSAGKL